MVKFFLQILPVQLFRTQNRQSKNRHQTHLISPSNIEGGVRVNVVSSTPHHEWGSLTFLVVIGTDYTVSCKCNYHLITTTIAPYI
jgi:hypothetical protein